MKKKHIIPILCHMSFALIFAATWAILHFATNNLDYRAKSAISIACTVLLSPNVKTFQTQTGKKMQLSVLYQFRLLCRINKKVFQSVIYYFAPCK